MTEVTIVQVSIRLPKPVHTRLAALSRREGRSINKEVNRMIRVHLDADKQRRRGQ